MFVTFRRIHKCQWVQLMTTCLVLSVVMLCWEQLDNSVVSHVKSYSYRYLVDNRFTSITRSLTISREEARSFSSFPYLLDHPHKCAHEEVFLLLFVKTSPENVERRKAIRSTWGNETYIRRVLGETVKVVFALGAVRTRKEEPSWSKQNNLGLQEQLVREDRLHGDLIQQDFLDSFHNLTLKLLLQFHWTHKNCAQAQFLMTADDDIFVHMPNLLGYLRNASRRGVTDFWVGRVHRGAPPIRTKASKYYVPLEMYPWLTYPDYTAGAGYVISGDVAEKVYHASLTLNASLYIDDVFMGICASAVGVSPQEHVFFSGEGKAPYHSCIYNQMLTSHGHVEDIYDLWKVATNPQLKKTPGMVGSWYCTAVKVALLCKPYNFNTYPCKAAFM
ncbi:lactosylceramide 1,3-N-acetyl-beta-D-glucosaminyltransferase A-like [Gouania willdenowi]|uniref:Hexosyltransferase n=1 Tax=Gouania willdenowi TaxID=441366 RepID=A0A8C5ES69_GOUWI|nr:lactosylceramide 1,3-N-acetyl-beta-D-glucosaminyltransferase A-like [Gouania willdenowi]XP_028328927.1 lactosylceramide 1,3-N-acetyl-beta-D-glucosaminyltransferase A-like [Gouania willdenowi]XP_028328928.1 lactosylceramide 1,3-N-acetyl-beta-D-glucosaminyltransferase A-like [Gouania willdenowi]XP_028328929.1 lactosylceramide 1,3-N-acetyl-beta-D-glucosaminyltransferase A-like [Gouania willdenowi]XP_028328930.1 lactosylceramide 1,3-N-acetyl-beta-D-glucosaminyltransferase A-like [Gouania willden